MRNLRDRPTNVIIITECKIVTSVQQAEVRDIAQQKVREWVFCYTVRFGDNMSLVE